MAWRARGEEDHDGRSVMATPTPTAHADMLLKHAIADVIRAGQRILIVGCPPGTFPYWIATHEAIVLWSTSEAKASDDRRMVPVEIGAVLITKLLSHALEQNVRHQARERRLTCPAGTMSPGAVLRLLDGVIVKPQKKEDDMAKPGPTHVVDVPLDDQTQALVDQLDEAIAAIQLVRESVITNGRQLSGIRDQLDALATLKRVLK